MFYVTESGRVVNNKAYVGSERYIEVLSFPKVPSVVGKVGRIKGIDKEKNSVLYEYDDIPAELLHQPEEEKVQARLDYISMMLGIL